MAIHHFKRYKRRLLRLSLISLVVIAILGLGLHIWFVNNARHLIIQIVSEKSHGKLKLKLSQVSFNFFSNDIQVKQASIVSTDSLVAPTTYEVNFSKLSLKSGSLWSLLFQRQLILDSIKLHDPQIVVTHWRKDTTRQNAKDELSISQEMGKLYNSMLDGLEAFGIRRVMINNAKLTLVNKIRPGEQPVTVSNIYLNLLRVPGEGKKRDEYIENEQTVDLTTSNQDIYLPGGRHKLSFRHFTLALFRKRIELDSCTVTAIAKDSMKSSYTIFFKKLLLVGVDFTAMYRHNLIKADSVYCADPLFNININTLGASKTKKEKPDAEKIIQELTGDLDLAFIGVKDAGIHINIKGKKNRSLFNSNKDDFEMRGLRINADSSSPVVVKRFDMLVMDYHLYDKDSSTVYSFDSIHFINNKIALNNFTLVSDPRRVAKTASVKNFSIPYFELTGLDWFQLVFEENLRASEALLINPVISYEKKQAGTKKKKANFFGSLRTLDDLIALDKITLVNGKVRVIAGPGSYAIDNAGIVLHTNTLLGSTSNEGLRQSVENLSFSKAVVHLNGMDAAITNGRYTGKNLLYADNISVTGKKNKTNAWLNNVSIGNLVINEEKEKFELEGLRWKSGRVNIASGNEVGMKQTKGSWLVKNVEGNNTRFSFTNGKINIKTDIGLLRLSSFGKTGTSAMHAQGLEVDGSNLSLFSSDLHLTAGSYFISGYNESKMSGVEFTQLKDRDSLSVKIAQVNFQTDINELLNNDYHVTNLEVTRPVVRLSKWTNPVKTNGNESDLNIRIDRMSAIEPDIFLSFHRDDSVTKITIPQTENSVIKTEDLVINNDGARLGRLTLNTTSATLVKRSGEMLGVEKGEVDLDVSGIRLSGKDGKSSWAALVNKLRLKNPGRLSFGKSNLQFDETSVGNVNISSEYYNNFSRLLKFNLSAWLKTTSGQYSDSATTIKWWNAEYNADRKILSLDSFQYHPAPSRDSVMSSSAYQTDYITLSSGRVAFIGFNADKYEKDSSLVAESMEINQPIITIYRDKKPPFQSGILKPLPVDMIRLIGLPVEVNKIHIADGLLSYTEKNAKTRAEGTVTLNHLEADIINIKNRLTGPADSLRLTMNAYLMDSTLLRLTVNESYADSLRGFLMTLKLKPTTLSFLNPVLIPLSNVKITSGTIDSFDVRANGHNEWAIGEMKMYYHDLRIKLVKNGEEAKAGLLGNFATFLANAFVIKKNNNGRTGIIYFERLKDRSFFNYLVKMTFSGMATSIGAKSNKKYIKKYTEALRKRKLPVE
jgi:hypothetical protein